MAAGGWTFDYLSEQQDQWGCIEFGRTILHDKFVVAPSTVKEASAHSPEYEKHATRLPGCIGSSDAIVNALEKVE